MRYEVIVADPAKNITLLVLTPVENRAEAARLLMADPSLGAEQVGFVLPPAAPQGLWRLEMMGGEFCGNAARSFGLWVARTLGYTGAAEIPIAISGMREPLMVRVNGETGTAEAAMPLPLARETLRFADRALPAYVFEGITHIIAPGIPPEQGLVYTIKEQVERSLSRPQALGVLFYDEDQSLMIPAVYVYATDSLVFESSCGSGSAALGVWQEERRWEGEGLRRVLQPGGVIEVRVGKRQGALGSLSIGGPVFLGERIVRELPG
jgi:diaminopimelate epimerase